MIWPYLFLIALVSSIAIESVVIYISTRLFIRNQPPNKVLILACTLPTLVTLPVVWLVFPFIVPPTVKLMVNSVVFSIPLYALVSESFATLLEGLIIGKILGIGSKKGMWFSFTANLTSFLLGNVILMGFI